MELKVEHRRTKQTNKQKPQTRERFKLSISGFQKVKWGRASTVLRLVDFNVLIKNL